MTHEDMIANILATYDAATDMQRARGERWYPRMTALAAGRATSVNADIRHAAGVYASYSVNTGWSPNLAHAARTFRGQVVRTLGGNIARAHACLSGAWIADTLAPKSRARKIVAFASNIAGDYSRVTVDRWALRVAYGTAEGFVPDGAEYDAIEAAYVEAAFKRNTAPAHMQAVTWIVLRDLTARGRKRKVMA